MTGWGSGSGNDIRTLHQESNKGCKRDKKSEKPEYIEKEICRKAIFRIPFGLAL